MPDQLKKMCLQKLYLIAVTFDVFDIYLTFVIIINTEYNQLVPYI